MESLGFLSLKSSSSSLPDSVTSIGELAFWWCESLTSVTFERTEGWYLDEALTQSVEARQLASWLKAGAALYMRCD